MYKKLSAFALSLVVFWSAFLAPISSYAQTAYNLNLGVGVWPQIQNFDAGFNIRYSSVLFDRFSVNSSGSLLIQATEKAPGASTAALAGAGAGNVNTGTHSYKVTFVTASGETDAGAVSNTITTTAGDGQVNLTSIPTGSANFVTSRKVYRTAAGNAVTGPWLLLATIADNSTTTYADNIADASLTTTIPSTNTAIDVRTSLTNAGALIQPTLIGGTGTTSTLTIQSTSGVGASGADIIFKVGNNGATEAMRVKNDGTISIHSDGSGNSRRLYFNNGSGDGYIYVSNDNKMHISGYADVIVFDNGFGTNIIRPSSGANIDIQYADLTLFKSAGVDSWLRSKSQNLYLQPQSTYHVILTPTSGYVGAGADFTPASLLDLRAGDLTFSGANGQKYVQGRTTELVSVGSGLTTKATTIQIPADAIVYAVPVRVKTQPGGTTNFTVTATTSGTAFQKGANISTAAGTTDPGTKNTPVNYNSVAAQTITFTFNTPTTDALGEIRVDIYYATSTPPTS